MIHRTLSIIEVSFFPQQTHDSASSMMAVRSFLMHMTKEAEDWLYGSSWSLEKMKTWFIGQTDIWKHCLRQKKRPDSSVPWLMKWRRFKLSICTPLFWKMLCCLHWPVSAESGKRRNIQKGGIFMRYFKVDVRKEPTEHGFMPAMQMYLLEESVKKRPIILIVPGGG